MRGGGDDRLDGERGERNDGVEEGGWSGVWVTCKIPVPTGK